MTLFLTRNVRSLEDWMRLWSIRTHYTSFSTSRQRRKYAVWLQEVPLGLQTCWQTFLRLLPKKRLHMIIISWEHRLRPVVYLQTFSSLPQTRYLCRRRKNSAIIRTIINGTNMHSVLWNPFCAKAQKMNEKCAYFTVGWYLRINWWGNVYPNLKRILYQLIRKIVILTPMYRSRRLFPFEPSAIYLRILTIEVHEYLMWSIHPMLTWFAHRCLDREEVRTIYPTIFMVPHPPQNGRSNNLTIAMYIRHRNASSDSILLCLKPFHNRIYIEQA